MQAYVTRTHFLLCVALVNTKHFTIAKQNDAFGTWYCKLGAQIEVERHLLKLDVFLSLLRCRVIENMRMKLKQVSVGLTSDALRFSSVYIDIDTILFILSLVCLEVFPIQPVNPTAMIIRKLLSLRHVCME